MANIGDSNQRSQETLDKYFYVKKDGSLKKVLFFKFEDIKEKVRQHSWRSLIEQNDKFCLKTIKFVELYDDTYVFVERGSQKKNGRNRPFSKLRSKDIQCLLNCIVDSLKQAHNIGVRVKSILDVIEIDDQNNYNLIKIQNTTKCHDLFKETENRYPNLENHLDKSDIKAVLQILRKIIAANREGTIIQLEKIQCYKQKIQNLCNRLKSMLDSPNILKIDQLQKQFDLITETRWSRDNFAYNIPYSQEQESQVQHQIIISSDRFKQDMLYYIMLLKSNNQFNHCFSEINVENPNSNRMNEIMQEDRLKRCIQEILFYLNKLLLNNGFLYKILSFFKDNQTRKIFKTCICKAKILCYQIKNKKMFRMDQSKNILQMMLKMNKLIIQNCQQMKYKLNLPYQEQKQESQQHQEQSQRILNLQYRSQHQNSQNNPSFQRILPSQISVISSIRPINSPQQSLSDLNQGQSINEDQSQMNNFSTQQIKQQFHDKNEQNLVKIYFLYVFQLWEKGHQIINYGSITYSTQNCYKITISFSKNPNFSVIPREYILRYKIIENKFQQTLKIEEGRQLKRIELEFGRILCLYKVKKDINQ